MQLFERQTAKDGNLTIQVWAPDRNPAPEGEEDPDDNDNLPIPRFNRKGKEPDHIPVYQVSDDEDDDFRILDPIDAIPISWSPHCVPAKTDAGTSRKQTGESGSDDPAPKKPEKARIKPSRVKNMPTTKG